MTDGRSEGCTGPSQPHNIVALPRRAVPVSDGNGEEWKTPLDCLKELVNHLEHGRMPMPNLLYVAMQIENNKEGVAYPVYCWSPEDAGHLSQIGHLNVHIHQLCRSMYGED